MKKYFYPSSPAEGCYCVFHVTNHSEEIVAEVTSESAAEEMAEALNLAMEKFLKEVRE